MGVEFGSSNKEFTSEKAARETIVGVLSLTKEAVSPGVLTNTCKEAGIDKRYARRAIWSLVEEQMIQFTEERSLRLVIAS